jgi:glycosyltransferase involved in cell wall biosynthesis
LADREGLSSATVRNVMVTLAVTGLLAPERDSSMLAEYLERLLSDRSLWAEFSRQGIENAKNRFDIVTQTARLEDLYSAAIAEFKPV